MPQVSQPKSPHWKQILVIAASLIVLGLLIGGVVYWQWLAQADTRYTNAVNQGNNDMRYQQYTAAIKTYQDFLGTGPTKDRTYRIQIALAQAYQQQGNNAAALAAYQKAATEGTSLDLVVQPGIGDTAQALGQKARSISAYNRAITLVSQTTTPDRFQTLHEYEASITSQGGTVNETAN